MIPGRWLLRIARAGCAADSCDRILEPAIADLQHDVDGATGTDRLRRLANGYAAFWSALISCVTLDVSAPPSRQFLGRSVQTFAGVVAASWLLELMAMRWAPARALLLYFPYLGWYARSGTATLIYAVPLATWPALRRARKGGVSTAGVTRLTGVAAGVVLTVVASGWLAPAIERSRIVQDRRAFIERNPGRFYVPPVEEVVNGLSTSKSLAALIRGAISPPPHRFPGYPNYVAPEDQLSHDGHWRDLKFRTLIVLFAAACAAIGVCAPRTPRTS